MKTKFYLSVILFFYTTLLFGSSSYNGYKCSESIFIRLVNFPDSISNKTSVGLSVISAIPALQDKPQVEKVNDSLFLVVIRSYFKQQQLHVNINDKLVDVFVNGDVEIGFDYKKMNSSEFICFKGESAKVCSFYNLFQQQLNFNKKSIKDSSSLNLKKKTLTYIDSTFQKRMELVSSFFTQNPQFSDFVSLAQEIVSADYLYKIIARCIAEKQTIPQSYWRPISEFSPNVMERNVSRLFYGIKKYENDILLKSPSRIGLLDYLPKLISKYPNMRSSLRDTIFNYLELCKNKSDKKLIDSLAPKIAVSVRKLYKYEIRYTMYENSIKACDTLFTHREMAELVKLQFCMFEPESVPAFYRYYNDEFKIPWIREMIEAEISELK